MTSKPYRYGGKSVLGLIDRAELKAWNDMNKLARESYFTEQDMTDVAGELQPRPATVLCRSEGCTRPVRVASGYCPACIKKTTATYAKREYRPKGIKVERYADWRRRLGHDQP